jgi:hypothetical protein
LNWQKNYKTKGEKAIFERLLFFSENFILALSFYRSWNRGGRSSTKIFIWSSIKMTRLRYTINKTNVEKEC